jgi:hypothetical protein
VKHKWERVERDMRRSVMEPRPLLARCAQCGCYRMAFKWDDHWETYYGFPYGARNVKRAPECRARHG